MSETLRPRSADHSQHESMGGSLLATFAVRSLFNFTSQ